VDVVARDVLEQRLEVDLLLIIRADRGARGLADDRDHRLVIHLRVVQAVHADSSWRTWMNRMLSFARSSAVITPLMPSPGYPKIVRTPQAFSLSTM
jgi:hypothetical protein